MNRLTASLLSMMLMFFIGVGAASVRLARRTAPAAQASQNRAVAPEAPREFSLVIPQAVWEPIFFKSIDARAKKANLPGLRAPLAEGDLEVRVWGGFGLTPLEGFRLNHTSSRWSAAYLGSSFSGKHREEYEMGLAQPKSGWEGAWNRLVGLGILELPDAESAGCSTGINDGYSYVVETNFKRVYRTYLYDNPDFSKCAEAKRMLSIAAAIADEFGLEEFKPAGNLKD